MTRLFPLSISLLLIALVTVGACQDTSSPAQQSTPDATAKTVELRDRTGNQPLFALSTFAYAFTQKASDTTFELTLANSQMYVVQLDNGVLWENSATTKPLPDDERRKWKNFKRHRPDDQPFYLSLAPLDFDRTRLAGPLKGSTTPASIKNAAFDSDAVKTAYLKYARRAVDYFEPDFLNLGVEAGELAHRRPGVWPAFARLIEFVMADLKRDHPNLKIGISFGLQSLMDPAAAKRAHDLVEKCDYLGLSFYPYMSQFHEKFGAKPLPDPPNQWREPLAWARDYTTRPIAICETGYNSANTSATGFNVHLKGSPALQKQYIEELGAIARRDHHLFDIYYFPIDINLMLEAMPDKGASGAILWRENGLLDSNLKPKPAWKSWQNILTPTDDSSAPAAPDSVATSPPKDTAPSASQIVNAVGFSSKSELFKSGPGGDISFQKNATPTGADAMKWSYSLSPGQWQWAVRDLDTGSVAGAIRLEFDLKGEPNSSLIVQLKEHDGESFFYAIQLSSKWSHLSIDLNDFELDPNTRRNATLNLSNLSQIVLAKEGKQKDSTGALWLANLVFTR